jgi:hypothetical protein
MSQQSKGLKAFGILGILFGLIGLLYNGFLVAVVMILRSAQVEVDPAVIEALEAITPPIMLSMTVNALTGSMVLAAGIGVLRLKGWGRSVYLAAAVLTLVNRVLTFPMHFQQSAAESEAVQQAANRAGAMFGDIVVIGFNALVLWYFTRPAVKAAFQTTPQETGS